MLSNKVKSLVYLLDRYEWISWISAMIMMAVSINLFIHYSAQAFEIIIIIGLMAILKGFLNFHICLSLDLATHKPKGIISFVYVALINIFIGITLILNLLTSPLLLILLVSAWMAIDSYPYIQFIIRNKIGFQHKYNPFIFSYLAILIVIIMQVMTLKTTAYGPALTTGSFLMLSCLNLFLLKKESKAA
ncbi:hypothetical protein DOK76_08320 [Vagococcus sp. DIV0080]|uniref:Integral membrane protein n=1 Tax=Candidatus Vagococcus giribetii TaxID=2230876 RepID=A0ABS3HTI4_9ENTE|nr:hypothetical protein [Vagococcus sp. DIV0080]MBO0477073.1 hypothetical protein [Vagococcus sp. DIV0080]